MSSHTEPSWCHTTSGDTAEGTFRWTIDDFKDRPENAGQCLKSVPLTVNGPNQLKTKWELEIYPKGMMDYEDEDYIWVFLSSQNDIKVTATFDLHVIGIDGAETDMEGETHTDFEEYDEEGSWELGGLWLKRDTFEDHPDLLPNGNLTLKCKITVFGTERVLSGLLFARCQKQLSEHFGNLFIDKQLSDIKIECEGKIFDCHQAIS